MESKFMKNLRALARMTNRDMTPEAFELFEALVLEPYGEDAAQMSLNQFVRTTARGFPMPGELIGIIDPAPNAKQIASEVSAKMLGMISRRGYTWTDTYKYDGHASFEDAVIAELGPEAVSVLNRCGGWQRFCEQFDQGANPNARPQLRDLLEVSVMRANAIAPRLDAPRSKPRDSVGEYLAERKALLARKPGPEAP